MTPTFTPRLAGLSVSACLVLLAVAGCPSASPPSVGLKPAPARKLSQASDKPSSAPIATLRPQGSPSPGATVAPGGSPTPLPTGSSGTPDPNATNTPTPTPSATSTPTPTPSATRTPKPSSGSSTPRPTAAPSVLIVDTLAGGSQGFADGTGAAARFDTPRGLAVDSNGNLYVADSANHRVRKVTPTGEVTTIAGSVQGFADDDGTQGLLNAPEGLAISPDGKALWIADTGNHAIRRVDLENAAHAVTTFAGGTQGYMEGTGEDAQFDAPVGLAVDATGQVWVADTGNHALRQITAGGEVSTVAGGTAGYIDTTYPGVRFQGLTDLALNAAGLPFVADAGNHVIRRIALTSAAVETLAGDGSVGTLDAGGDNARFSNPCGMAFDTNGNLLVADRANHRLRLVTSAGVVTTLAGDVAGTIEGSVTSARFNEPSDVAVTSAGVIYVADTLNHRIRVIKGI